MSKPTNNVALDLRQNADRMGSPYRTGLAHMAANEIDRLDEENRKLRVQIARAWITAGTLFEELELKI